MEVVNIFYIILFFILFFIVLLIYNYKYKYNWVFFTMVLGLIISLLSITIYISRIGNHEYSGIGIYKYDYYILLYLNNLIKISHDNLLRMLNLGIVIFLFSIPIFIQRILRNNLIKIDKDNYSISRIAAVFFIPCSYLLFYDPKIAYYFHINIFYQDIFNKRLFYLIKFIDIFFTISILIYLLYPVFLMYSLYKKSEISTIRKYILSICISLFLLNIFFYIFFFLGMLRVSYLAADGGIELFRFAKMRYVPIYYFSFIPVLGILITLTTFFLLTKNGLMSLSDFFHRRLVDRSLKKYNENFRGVFHSYKNTLFTIKILSEQAIMQAKEDKSEYMKRIREVSEHSLNSVSKVLDVFKNTSISLNTCDLKILIDESLKEIHIPKNIGIVKTYTEEEADILTDEYQFSQVIINLIENAVDAINDSWKSEGEIIIDLKSEYDWIVLNITDNGIGLTKEERKKIFQPFYSTKSKHNSWGVGLSYVYKIVKRYFGYVNVYSVRDKYTTFEIILPKARRV